MSQKVPISVALVTMAPFPVGNVSTLRYSSYMKALAEKGNHSYVLVYCPTSMAAHIKKRCCIYDGIHYQYATKITWPNKFILVKVFYLLVGLVKSVYYLNKQNLSTLILYGNNDLIVTLFYWLYAKLHRIKFIGDRSELPSERERNSKILLWIYGVKQKLFDGMIIMTKRLIDFYSQYSKKQSYIFFLPMTIDKRRFENVIRRDSNLKYIAIVFGTHNRDGLIESLKSYNIYRSKGGTYQLILIGNYYEMPNKKDLDQVISHSIYRDSIIIKGLVKIDAIPDLLANASCLLTTPNYYISGGFPTKLGDYMLSGVPIVATKIGELLDYIEPNVDMLMSTPGDLESIANDLLYVENNPICANEMACKAKETAMSLFNAETYIIDLIQFLS